MTRVAIVSGICVEHDAISNAIAGQAAALCSMPGIEAVDVIAQHVARHLPCESHQVGNAWQLLRHPAYRAADVAIFHWGIHYDLFDALTIDDRSGPQPAVHFHNCTPEELLPPHARTTAERSLRQAQLLASRPIRVWTYSEFNRRTLDSWGVPPERISFVPFAIEPPRPLTDRRQPGHLDLLSVGRLVPAKGQHVLIEALALLPGAIRSRCRVRFAGNSSFSEATYSTDLIELARVRGVRDLISFVGQPDDEDLWRLYESSHVVVSTSLHEGFCVPIVEGYHAECRAIGTTAGNLPFVVVPPDPIVPVLEPEPLAAAIAGVANQPVHPDPEGVSALLERHGPRAERDALRAELCLLMHERCQRVSDSTQTPTSACSPSSALTNNRR
jgi:glycosyltransferase involved in cell wall biosynthesis